MTKPISTERRSCIFCKIIEGTAPAEIVREWPDAVAFVPLGPVVEGHVLVVPRVHVDDVTEDSMVSATTMARAAELAREAFPCNVITSAGGEATQTIFHLHIHIVPRRAGDDLHLPWTDQVVSG
ncbi:HIT domain-containing protein [Actinomadura sp. NPDC048032]|uniref:HIT family protein n=1 Tax=Actinomadura sp. NPDC048032 TaxID=3155747 RepID=UPI0033FCF0EA